MPLGVIETIFQEQSGENFQISSITIKQPPAQNPALIIKKGEDFEVELKFDFTEIVGDLHAHIVFDAYAQNIATGGVEAQYNIHHEEDLPTAPPTQITRTVQFSNVQALGTFMYSAVVTLPDSNMAAFSIGPFFMVFA